MIEKIQAYAIPALLSTSPLEINDLEVLKSSLPFRSRGAILPVNYLDLFSWGGGGVVVLRDGNKDNPEFNIGREHQERKKKKNSPFEMSKSVGGGTDLLSSLFLVMLLYSETTKPLVQLILTN